MTFGTPSETQPRRDFKRGALAGAGAGLIMTVVMMVTRFVLNAVSLPELLSEWIVSITPAVVFAAVLGVLEAYAKPLLFVGLLFAQVAVGGFLGVLYTLVLEPVPFHKEPRWPRGLLFALALWAVSALVVVPIAGGGLLGSLVVTGQTSFLLGLLVPYVAYGWFLTSAYQDLTEQPSPEDGAPGRRYVLKWAAIGVFAVAFGGYAARLFSQRGPSTTAGGIAGGVMPSPVTPTKDFYIVSKNLIDPVPSTVGWELQVDGLVEQPYTLNYDELTAMPWVEVYDTLECISNRVGGDLIGNAKWRGVPLKDILERAVLLPEAADVVSYAQDGYHESLPREMALRPQVLVAYMMNDELLPIKHGFPARLIIPGLFGEKCTKWLEHLEATDEDHKGFWQRNGWGDSGEVLTTSQIRVPENGDKLATGEILVGGVAFSGDKGISQVEFSPDGGSTWHPATLQAALSPYSWVLWTTQWVPTEPGKVRLMVRTTDASGEPQVVTTRGSFPDGATGLHGINVTIKSGEPD